MVVIDGKDTFLDKTMADIVPKISIAKVLNSAENLELLTSKDIFIFFSNCFPFVFIPLNYYQVLWKFQIIYLPYLTTVPT